MPLSPTNTPNKTGALLPPKCERVVRLRCAVTARYSVVRRRVGALRIPARPIPILVRYRPLDLYRLIRHRVNLKRHRFTIEDVMDQLLPCLSNSRLAIANPIVHAPAVVRVRTAQIARFWYSVQTSALMELSRSVSFGLSCQVRATLDCVPNSIHPPAQYVNMPDEILTIEQRPARKSPTLKFQHNRKLAVFLAVFGLTCMTTPVIMDLSAKPRAHT